MTTDIQLFILWNNGRQLEKQILTDIGNHYEIMHICEVFWQPKHFAHNLARFYGKNLRKGTKKIKECGTGPFLVIIVRDPSPQYYNGKNINMRNSKSQYRKLFGNGYMIHASDNSTEAFENFLLLSGQNITEFAAFPHTDIHTLGDTVGSSHWNTENEIRTILNKIPNCRLVSDNNIWLLNCSNPNYISRLLNAKKCLLGKNLFSLKLGKQKQKIRILPVV